MNIRRNCAHASGVDKQFICAPRCTTLVSPVTMAMPAVRAFLPCWSLRLSVSPSAILLRDKATGEIARNSATDRNVIRSPQIASLPILPPGKNSGSMTYCRWRTPDGRLPLPAAPAQDGLIFLFCQPRVGKGFHKQAVINCCIAWPPLPWASWILFTLTLLLTILIPRGARSFGGDHRAPNAV